MTHRQFFRRRIDTKSPDRIEFIHKKEAKEMATKNFPEQTGIKNIPEQTQASTTLRDGGLMLKYAQERAMRDHYTDPQLRNLGDIQAVSNVLSRVMIHEITIPSSWVPQDARPGESQAEYVERMRGQ